MGIDSATVFSNEFDDYMYMYLVSAAAVWIDWLQAQPHTPTLKGQLMAFLSSAKAFLLNLVTSKLTRHASHYCFISV